LRRHRSRLCRGRTCEERREALAEDRLFLSGQPDVFDAQLQADPSTFRAESEYGAVVKAGDHFARTAVEQGAIHQCHALITDNESPGWVEEVLDHEEQQATGDDECSREDEDDEVRPMNPPSSARPAHNGWGPVRPTT